MARHSGKNLKVLHGVNEIDGCDGFDIEETHGTTDLTSAGEAWKSHETVQGEWSGTITMKADHAAAANQSLRSGDSIDISGYTEGDGSGKSYLSGTCTITSHKVAAAFDGTVTREYSVMGNGALSVDVVA